MMAHRSVDCSFAPPGLALCQHITTPGWHPGLQSFVPPGLVQATEWSIFFEGIRA